MDVQTQERILLIEVGKSDSGHYGRVDRKMSKSIMIKVTDHKFTLKTNFNGGIISLYQMHQILINA